MSGKEHKSGGKTFFLFLLSATHYSSLITHYSSLITHSSLLPTLLLHDLPRLRPVIYAHPQDIIPPGDISKR